MRGIKCCFTWRSRPCFTANRKKSMVSQVESISAWNTVFACCRHTQYVTCYSNSDTTDFRIMLRLGGVIAQTTNTSTHVHTYTIKHHPSTLPHFWWLDWKNWKNERHQAIVTRACLALHSLTLGAHAQRGLQYLVCVCVCLSVKSHLTYGASVRPEKAVT